MLQPKTLGSSKG
uniref:Uncharacterized protein n=1 Tax=Rhizophora mucronata TaxID=61149 RepID=A0A2P2MY48_RHIMU